MSWMNGKGAREEVGKPIRPLVYKRLSLWVAIMAGDKVDKLEIYIGHGIKSTCW